MCACVQYFFFVSIITVILFAVGIAVYVKRDQADVYIAKAWAAASVDTKDSLQAAFSCCGLVVFNLSGSAQDSDDGAYAYPCDLPRPDITAANPCQPIMVSSFQTNFNTAGSCGIAFSVVMVLSLALTAWLMRGIRETAVNQAIEKNRARNERDMAKNRKKGKGLKIPQVGPGVL